eukprot:scaffold6411_cov173-Prasinococcus_capsulatus_cf.AAC.1
MARGGPPEDSVRSFRRSTNIGLHDVGSPPDSNQHSMLRGGQASRSRGKTPEYVPAGMNVVCIRRSA